MAGKHTVARHASGADSITQWRLANRGRKGAAPLTQ